MLNLIEVVRGADVYYLRRGDLSRVSPQSGQRHTALAGSRKFCAFDPSAQNKREPVRFPVNETECRRYLRRCKRNRGRKPRRIYREAA